MYIVFSQRVSVRSKASERRFSHSKASSDNAVCGRTRAGLTNKINMLGASDKRHLCVAALANGVTIACELRLDLALVRSPEYDIHCRRVNAIT